MSQATSQPRFRWILSSRWLYGGVLLVVAVVAAASYSMWMPHLHRLLALPNPPAHGEGEHSTIAGEQASDGHAGHNHAEHSEADSLELSEQARKNIGLRVAKVELKPFTRTISIPGIVVERPGRSTVEITAPMTGIVTAIYAIEGQAVEPGQKLFDLRLTDEDLAQSQADLLRTAENLEVIVREIKRIEDLIKDQALPGKQLLERQYEQQKEQVTLRAQKQALLLHGMSQTQIDAILQQHTLLQTVSIYAPPAAEMQDAAGDLIFQVQGLKVTQGQHVTAGDTLAVLADHAELYIEGEAFERDVSAVSQAAEREATASAVVESDGSQQEVVFNLRILYLAAKVNAETRTLDFYVSLPNQRQRDSQLSNGQRFIAWKFRPGQRVQLQIPVETWADRIVLPADAVVQDGAETYVFTPNGDHLVRRSVHVEYRDPQWAVIANDGILFPGDPVAVSAARQLQLALKNKAGGGIDPHAGHNH